MGDIINLNRVRKDRAQTEARARAATNRVVHGRTKAEKQAAAKTRERAEKHLDGQKLED
ncbi:DUF4169 family protein [Brevundimonas sp.]|uniref:DUF4169 family protein n=1 Tax=Brevundimonas sp. TaxID=1871086 RepID=UPI00289DE367|nr:DUF4169 family protein [Brevundimonas sp.]